MAMTTIIPILDRVFPVAGEPLGGINFGGATPTPKVRAVVLIHDTAGPQTPGLMELAIDVDSGWALVLQARFQQFFALEGRQRTVLPDLLPVGLALPDHGFAIRADGPEITAEDLEPLMGRTLGEIQTALGLSPELPEIEGLE